MFKVGLNTAPCSTTSDCKTLANFECSSLSKCSCILPYVWNSGASTCDCSSPYSLINGICGKRKLDLIIRNEKN